LCAGLTAPVHPAFRARGFTLIELMMVVMIVAILLVIGVPAMSEFVAAQRVRTAASDIAAEMAFARAKAIETSRRVYIEKLGPTWLNGWRIYADLNDNGAYDAGEELKEFDGFAPGSMYSCSTVLDFANNVIFRPDGRVVRTTAPSSTDAIYVVDTMGDSNVCNNKIRALYFGLTGRATVEVVQSGTANCQGVLPPC